MKRLIICLLIFVTGFCFAQTYNHILIDKLTFTINDLEISGGIDSATTLNWKANLTVNGLEMQYEDQNFQEFANNITDGDEIIIDQFKATISMFNNVLKISNAKFSSPFLKADIKAEMLIDVSNPGETWIESSTIKLDVLSNALESFVFEIEKELGQALPRKGKSIVIEASGPLGNPKIKDMDKEKNVFINKSGYASEAKIIINNIINASQMYYTTYGEWPNDVEELERRGQIEIDSSIKLKWTFTLSLSDDGGYISAASTDEMKGGPGKVVIYDRASGKFMGYGSTEDEAELTGKSFTSKEGITDEKIIIGNIQDLSGPIKELGILIPSGSQLYFDYINDQGGVNGRKIEMLVEDHMYNPLRAEKAARYLIEKEEVFCLYNVIGTSPVKAIMPILNEYKVPLIAPATASEDITNPAEVGWDYIFQIEANYKKQAEEILKYILNNYNDVKLGVMYQNDAYGKDVLKGVYTIEREYNLSIKKESFERGATDFVNQTMNMENEGVTDIIVAGIVREPVTVMKTAEAIGYKVRLYGTSPTADPRVPLIAGESAENYIASYSFYLHNSNYSGPKLYRELCEKDNVPEKMRGLYHYYGFATAHVLVEGLKRAGNELTRKNLIDSMESINNWDNGFMLPITFGKNDHQGIEDVQFWQVKNGNWIQLK